MTEGTVTATLTRRGGAILATIELPKTLKQVPLNRFIDFLVECRNFGDENQNQFVVMARAISAFCDHPLSDIVEAELGSDEITALDGGLRGLFGYISNLIHTAKGTLLTPGNASFEYMGETYTIPVIMQQAMAGEYTLADLSVIETIEVLEVERFKTQKTLMSGDPNGHIRQKIMAVANEEMGVYEPGDSRRMAISTAANAMIAAETEKAGDPDGSLLYSKYLKMVAILCRSKGDKKDREEWGKIWSNDARREAWINERAAHFSFNPANGTIGIDSQTALNVDFFLTNILASSAQSHSVATFLSRQSFVLLASIRLKSGKRNSERKTTMRRYSSA